MVTYKAMPQRREWLDEHIQRFWTYQSTQAHRQRLYFTGFFKRALCNFLDLHQKLRGDILDYGCGPGILTEHLSKVPGVRVHALDSSTRSVDETRKRCAGLPGFQGATTSAQDLPPGTFDVVTLIETIEHLTPELSTSVLREVRDLLRPGGVLLVSTPNSENLEDGMILCPFCDAEFHHMQHFQSFTPMQLSKALEDAGLTLLYCRGVDLEQFDDAMKTTRSPLFFLRRHLLRFLRACFPTFGRRVELHHRSAGGRHLVALAQRPMNHE